MNSNIFQLIDFDRTIFDTSAFAKILTDEINITEPGIGTKLDELFEAAYKNEHTFFLLRHLRENHGDAWFEALVARVVEKVGVDTLYLNGAQERLHIADSLTSYRPSWGILTYGDEIDQRMKTAIMGLQDAPFLLTATPDKAGLIASWQNTDGTFTLPPEFGGGTVDSLTFEDDKLRAFKGLPDGVSGFWITQDDTATASARLNEAKRDGVPDSVVAVRDLAEVTTLLTPSV